MNENAATRFKFIGTGGKRGAGNIFETLVKKQMSSGYLTRR